MAEDECGLRKPRNRIAVFARKGLGAFEGEIRASRKTRGKKPMGASQGLEGKHKRRRVGHDFRKHSKGKGRRKRVREIN